MTGGAQYGLTYLVTFSLIFSTSNPTKVAREMQNSSAIIADLRVHDDTMQIVSCYVQLGLRVAHDTTHPVSSITGLLSFRVYMIDAM